MQQSFPFCWFWHTALWLLIFVPPEPSASFSTNCWQLSLTARVLQAMQRQDYLAAVGQLKAPTD